MKSGPETSSSSRGGRGGRKKALVQMVMADSTLVERAMADSITRALADSTTVSPPPPPQGRPHFIKTKQLSFPSKSHPMPSYTCTIFSSLPSRFSFFAHLPFPKILFLRFPLALFCAADGGEYQNLNVPLQTGLRLALNMAGFALMKERPIIFLTQSEYPTQGQ